MAEVWNENEMTAPRANRNALRIQLTAPRARSNVYPGTALADLLELSYSYSLVPYRSYIVRQPLFLGVSSRRLAPTILA